MHRMKKTAEQIDFDFTDAEAQERLKEPQTLRRMFGLFVQR